MMKILSAVLYADENILYFNEDSSNVVFNSNGMGILNIDPIILTLKILIIMKMVLILLFLSDFWLGILNLKNAKHLKKN